MVHAFLMHNVCCTLCTLGLSARAEYSACTCSDLHCSSWISLLYINGFPNLLICAFSKLLQVHSRSGGPVSPYLVTVLDAC